MRYHNGKCNRSKENGEKAGAVEWLGDESMRPTKEQFYFAC